MLSINFCIDDKRFRLETMAAANYKLPEDIAKEINDLSAYE